MSPGSAASLPDGTASTGLPCLLVGVREHRGRSDIEVDCVAATVQVSHLVWCVTYIYWIAEYPTGVFCCCLVSYFYLSRMFHTIRINMIHGSFILNI